MAPRGKLALELVLVLLVLAAGMVLLSAPLLSFSLFLFVRIMVNVTLAAGIQGCETRGRRAFSASYVEEGDAVEEKVTLSLSGTERAIVAFTEDDRISRSVAEGRAALCSAISGGEVLDLRFRARPPRGLYGGSLTVRLCDPGLYFEVEGEIHTEVPLCVFPRVEPVGRVRLRPRRALATPGLIPSRRGGSGILFFGTRPYVPGEGWSRLNWKALAKWEVPVVTLYEEERATEVALILDCRERVYREMDCPELFEYGVRACGSLASHFLAQGHRVGLLLFGEWVRWVYPGSGRIHRYRILRELAGATMGESYAFSAFEDLPVKLFPPGSSLVIVSPLVPADEAHLRWLRARGYEVLLLAMDPVSLWEGRARSEEERLALAILALERRLLVERLEGAGVRVAQWDVEMPLAAAIRTQWGRK